MSKRSMKYCKLHDIEQLERERRKLRSRIRTKEMQLMEDAEMVVERFSPANLLAEAWDRILCSSGLVQNIMVGIQTVRSFFSGMRSRRDDCGCDD